jgi:hypothetical protein
MSEIKNILLIDWKGLLEREFRCNSFGLNGERNMPVSKVGIYGSSAAWSGTQLWLKHRI